MYTAKYLWTEWHKNDIYRLIKSNYEQNNTLIAWRHSTLKVLNYLQSWQLVTVDPREDKGNLQACSTARDPMEVKKLFAVFFSFINAIAVGSH